jgi:DNA invertase Pin-like site-specific DNA recombinase
VDTKPVGKLIGYARVSTKDQELRLQLDDLKRAGCWNIYEEHASASKGRKRPQLELALTDLRAGDTLIVWKLDRLARNMRELLRILDRIQSSGAGFKSLKESIDLATPVGRMMLGVFGTLAQFESDLTAERTKAGIKAIQDRGLQYGALPKLSEDKAKALVKMRKSGATIAETARQFNVSTGSVRNYMLRAKGRKRR